MNQFLVEVNSRLKGNQSHQRKKVERSFEQAGYGKLECVNVGALYRLEGELSQSEVQSIAKEILCDTVSENFTVDPVPQKEQILFADIWYKKGVTDSVAESLLKAVKDIGIPGLFHAAHGQRFHFQSALDSGGSSLLEKKVTQFVNENLLNPLVQECKLTGL